MYVKKTTYGFIGEDWEQSNINYRSKCAFYNTYPLSVLEGARLVMDVFIGLRMLLLGLVLVTFELRLRHLFHMG